MISHDIEILVVSIFAALFFGTILALSFLEPRYPRIHKALKTAAFYGVILWIFIGCIYWIVFIITGNSTWLADLQK